MAHQSGFGGFGWPVDSAVTGLDLVAGSTLVGTISGAAILAALVALRAGTPIVKVLASGTLDLLELDAVSVAGSVARLAALVARGAGLAAIINIWGLASSAVE